MKERITPKDDIEIYNAVTNENTDKTQVLKWALCGKDYEDLEEQGLIVRLPCKVGDTVYHISDFGSVADECFDLEVGKIKSISLQEDGWWIYAVYDSGLTYWHNIDKKDYYLIKAEAEKKLKELKGDKK